MIFTLVSTDILSLDAKTRWHAGTLYTNNTIFSRVPESRNSVENLVTEGKEKQVKSP